MFALFLLGMAMWGIFAFAMRSSPDIEHAIKWQTAIMFSTMLSSIAFLHFSFLCETIILKYLSVQLLDKEHEHR